METLGDRIKRLRGSSTQKWLSEKLNIPATTLSNYENNKSELNTKMISALTSLFRVNTDWLLFGKEPMRDVGAGEAEPSATRIQTGGAHAKKGLEVVGLATCGLIDWYNPRPVAVDASLDTGAEAFGVIAIGQSLEPEGIKQGFVAICDPGERLEPDDVVYVEQLEPDTGKILASLKVYLKRDEKWIYLKSWLPPDEKGYQKPVTTQLSVDVAGRIIPAVTIKRKR